MLRMPAAAPRIWAGTELMMALVLGETKKPEPPPMRAMKIDNNQYGVDGPTVDNPNRPKAETPRPSGVSTREPTRSDNLPLSGPTIINAAPNGVSIRPALSGSCP